MMAIKAKNLTKKFGEKTALDRVDLEIEKGKIHAILGPNGAGKTTFIKLATTLLKPTSGHVQILGYDSAKDAQKVKELISLTAQNASIDEELSGYENIYLFARLLGYSAKKSKARAQELLEFFALMEAKNRIVKNYSGGMRRRLDIATSIVKTPEVLFLDEPTTGLDPRSRNELWEVIREIAKSGTTVVLTTQYLEEADQLADMITVIDQGRVISNATADELKSSVGKNILHFSLSNYSDLACEKTYATIAQINHESSTLTNQGNKFAISVNNATQSFDILKNLEEQNLPVKTFALSRPNLDEVFLALTGNQQKSQPQTQTEETIETPKTIQGIVDKNHTLIHAAAIKDSMMLGWRGLLKIKHIPEQFVDVLITPAMFTFMFSFMLGGALKGSTADYLAFLVPGMMVQTLAFNAVYSGLTIHTDFSKGIFDRFKSMPIWAPAPFIGIFIGDCLRHVISSLFLLIFASMIGFRLEASPIYVAGSIALVIFFSLSLSWFFVIMGLIMRSVSAVMSTSWLILMPLVFMSNIYADPATMPDWLQTFISFNPVSLQVDAVRSLFSGSFDSALITKALSVSLLISVIFAPIAITLYQKER
jgi:ABC-2 type transport system ATP-binding protein